MSRNVFNAGPSALPQAVLEKMAAGVIELEGAGYSVLEISHRSTHYDAIYDNAVTTLRTLLGVGDEYEVLFLTGGASTQFAMLPLNVLSEGRSADYIVTGAWSKKALAEANRIGKARSAGSGEASSFCKLPDQLDFDPEAVYVHFTSNNTIAGTEWLDEPYKGDCPLVCDASSDFLSRPLDIDRYSMIYAGAQKNLGPAGVTVVVLRRSFLPKLARQLPVIWDYQTHIKKKSSFNTPPVFAVWGVGLVLDWLAESGGLEAIERVNLEKSGSLYEMIDNSGGFFRGTADKSSRSRMNVTFRMQSEELERRFLVEATAAGLVGLKGHRSVGGLRASIYNAVEPASVATLVDFMGEFQKRNG